MKKLLTILPLLITVGFLTAGIVWLGFSFKQDQQQTFHVIKSGQVKTLKESEAAKETESCKPQENVCLASTTPLSTTQ